MNELKEKLEKEKTNPPKERTPEDIKKENDNRINKLTPEQRKELAEEYKNATADQKEILSTPEGLEAYLNMRLVKDSDDANPFSETKKEKEKTLAERVAEAFKVADKKTPTVFERDGIGELDLSEKAKQKISKQDEAVDAARDLFFN